MSGEHKLFYDTAGWADYPRWTCEMCDETCLRQPYMTLRQWFDKLKEFAGKHPSRDLAQYVLALGQAIG